MIPDAPPALPDDWEVQDSIESYFEAVRVIGERELPAMFKPRESESPDETAPVTIAVLGIERAPAGRLVGLAAVELLIDGVAIVLQGVRIIRTGPRGLGVEAPTFRGPTGAAVPTVILPPELSAAIARVVLDEYEADRRRPPVALFA